MAKLHANLQPFKPTEADPFDAIKAAHLLNRAGFGGAQEQIEKVMKLGPRGAVDWLLDFPDMPAEEQDKDDVPNLTSLEEMPVNFRGMRQMMAGKTEEERKLAFARLQQANRQALMNMGSWWLDRMADGRHPLQEKLTLFWHGHFTTSARDERSALLMWNQNELLRRCAAGNFRKFVQGVSRDPAMLDYLNNTQNHRNRPNENYARELMELFTLGIGNYTENDVKEAARAFTGWTHEGEGFVVHKWDHDPGTKTIFGRKGAFDGEDVVDLLMLHPACARYVSAKLFRFFVSDDLDESMNESLAGVLRGAKYDMRPLLRAIFTSRAFYAPGAIGVQVKSPVQLVVETCRLLGVEVPESRVLVGALNQMGQVPFMPPNVKGWPYGAAGGRAWINTSTLFVRQNTAVYLAGGGSPVRTGRRFADRRIDARAGTGFRAEGGKDAGEVVDRWVARLIQRPIEVEKRQVLVDALQGRPDREEHVRWMVQLIVSMPEYQLC
ncbi:MAG: DUF1800 domain-containing protein [Tepidisphaeraceae bacterium]